MKTHVTNKAIGRILLLVIFSWSAMVSAFAASVSGISIGRLDWYDSTGTLQVPRSSYGVMDMTISPDPSTSAYLNVVADDPGNSAPEAWIIQNMPILAASFGEDSSQEVDFDFQDLGDAPGTLVSSLLVRYSVTSTPLSSPPSGSMSTFTVSAVTVQTSNTKAGNAFFTAIARPAGQKAAGAETNVIQHKNVKSVQEGLGQCLAGSFARSIKWLWDGEAIYSTKTTQDIFNDLIALKVSSPTTSYADDVVAKASYLDQKLIPLGFRGVTAIDIVVAGSIGDTPGVSQETTDFITWLKRVLPTDDVELDFDGTNRHIVTITGMYDQGGATYVKYRDDEKQGDNSKGDTAEKRAKLTKTGANYDFREDPTGIFGGGNFKVQLGISEAISIGVPWEGVDTPALPIGALIAFGVALLVIGAFMLRRRATS